MESIQNIIIALICSAIKNTALPQKYIENINLEILPEIYKFSVRHDVTHLVAAGLFKNSLVDKSTDVGKKFFEHQMLAILRTERINNELNRICDLFENNEIPFIPLKGSVMRSYYPENWMRTSCDIDVLIKQPDLQKSIDLLVEKYNYTIKQSNNSDAYDISLFSPSGVHLELHYGLMEKMFESSTYLSKVWDIAVPKENKIYYHVMTDNMFYFYQIAHLAKHFKTSGCGIRLFLDIWILNHHKDFGKTELYKKYLDDVNLLVFEKAVVNISEVWFSGKDEDDLTASIQDYIFESGIYGTTSNYYASKQIKNGSKQGYALSRIFLPYTKLAKTYPSLKKHKYLLPYYQVKRWFDIILAGRFKKSLKELNDNNKISKEKLLSMYLLFNNLDLI